MRTSSTKLPSRNVDAVKFRVDNTDEYNVAPPVPTTGESPLDEATSLAPATKMIRSDIENRPVSRINGLLGSAVFIVNITEY